MIVIIKHIEIEGAGTLGDFFKQRGKQTKIIELDKGDTLPSLDGCEAVISLGGPMNVYEEDRYPFLKEETKFLKKAIKEEIPILGICLGAQLLAKACNAKVKKAPQKEVGWLKVNLTEEGRRDPLFENMPAQLSVFQWHEDTFEIPEGGVHLAESQTCLNQAFRFGRNAYGLQFHVEVTPEMVETWIRAYTENETAQTKEMLIEAYKGKAALRAQAQMLYYNFAGMFSALEKSGVK